MSHVTIMDIARATGRSYPTVSRALNDHPKVSSETKALIRAVADRLGYAPNLMAKGRRALGVMEMQLTFTDWIVGDQMTLADIALVAYTRVAHEGGFDLSDFPSVERWISRTEAALGIPHAREVAA